MSEVLVALLGQESKLYAVVVIGVNEHGQKKLLAVEDGLRELNLMSWSEVLLK